MKIQILKKTKILLIIGILTLSAFQNINIGNADNEIQNINCLNIDKKSNICSKISNINEILNKSISYKKKIFIFKDINELNSIKDIKKEIKNRKKYHRILLTEYNMDLKNKDLLTIITNNSIELSFLNEKLIKLKENTNSI